MAIERPSSSRSLQMKITSDTPTTSNDSNNNTSHRTATKSKNAKAVSKKRSFLSRRRTRSLEINNNGSISKTDADETTHHSASNLITNDDVPLVDATCAPSVSTLRDLKRVVSLIEEERHLVAYELYLHVKKRLDAWMLSNDRRGEETKDDDNTDDHLTYSESKNGHHHHRWRMGWRNHRHPDGQHHAVTNEEERQQPSELEENEEGYRFWIDRRKEFEALEVSQSV